MDAESGYREEARRELYKNATSYIKQFIKATSHETAVVLPPIFRLFKNPNKTDKSCKTLIEKQGWTHT